MNNKKTGNSTKTGLLCAGFFMAGLLVTQWLPTVVAQEAAPVRAGQKPGRGMWGGIPVMGKRLWIIESTPVGDGQRERQLLDQHLQHQLKIEKEGVLFGAGPATDIETHKRIGIIIIRADSAEQAKQIAEADPMHAGGGRTFRIREWLLNEGTVNIRLDFASGAYQFE